MHKENMLLLHAETHAFKMIVKVKKSKITTAITTIVITAVMKMQCKSMK